MSEDFELLMNKQFDDFSAIPTPPEISELLQTNTLQLLIKLARYKFATKLLRRSDDVLEVGSGSGVGTMFLAQHAAKVTGIELVERNYAAAKETCRRDNVTLLNMNVFDYDSSLLHDAVLSLDVIEHMPMEDGRRFLRCLASHCAKNGFMLIGSPSIYSYPYQGAYSRASHVKCYDQEELRGLMDELFERTFVFSMNDEVVHTGHPKMAWYYFVLGTNPKAA